jgi:uncharacterized protein (DUF427 family)
MTKISITNLDNKNVIATGVLGENIIHIEGNYYFKPELVDFDNTVMEDAAYFCPIKRSTCDYFYVITAKGEKMTREMCWIYDEVSNPLFKQIAGMVGFYSQNVENNGVSISIEEVE